MIMRICLNQRCVRFLSLFLVFISVCALCGCQRNGVGSFRQSDVVCETEAGPSPLYHTALSSMETVYLDTEYAMLYDAQSACVALADASSVCLWSALTVDGDIPSYALIVTVLGKDGICYLNSQDHAAAYGGVRCEKKENGVSVTYILSDSAATAAKTFDALDADALQVVVTVDYLVIDGLFTVEIDADAIKVPSGFVLEKLSVLPYFGALRYGGAAQDDSAYIRALFGAKGFSADAKDIAAGEDSFSDYVLLPDGCGAALYPGLDDAAYADLTFRVSPAAGDAVPAASLGMFGIKQSAGAFVCTVTEGLALADIRSVLVSGGDEKVRTAFAEFRLTATQNADGSTYFGGMYRGKLRLVYHFLSGVRADYIAMADACRETMIRAGQFREHTLNITDLPLQVSLLCSFEKKDKEILSDFTQAEDLLSQLKAKGVDTAHLVLCGMFPDGIAQNSSTVLAPAKALGGKKAFAVLCEYAHKIGYTVMGGVNLLYGTEKNAVKKLNGEKNYIYAAVNDFASAYPRDTSPVTALLTSDAIKTQTIRILRWLENAPVDGVCVNDVSSVHYDDPSGGCDPADLTEVIASQLSSFAGMRTLSLAGENACLLKDATVFLSVPTEPSLPQSASYVAVPVLPAVLHGSVLYAGTALNAATQPTLSFLKCAEYGAVPSAAWVCRSGSLLSFDRSLNQIAAWTKRLNSSLGDLYACRISGHQQVADGVYRTDYENGAAVFVNYNHFSVNVNSVQIPPYDYIRMN